jgi:hypothetical protein
MHCNRKPHRGERSGEFGIQKSARRHCYHGTEFHGATLRARSPRQSDAITLVSRLAQLLLLPSEYRFRAE